MFKLAQFNADDNFIRKQHRYFQMKVAKCYFSCTSPTQIGSIDGSLYAAILFGFSPPVANMVPVGFIAMLCMPQFLLGGGEWSDPRNIGMFHSLPDVVLMTSNWKDGIRCSPWYHVTQI